MTDTQKKELKTKIGEAIGYASVCWIPSPGKAEFDSTEASKVADNLYDYVNGILMEQSS